MRGEIQKVINTKENSSLFLHDPSEKDLDRIIEMAWEDRTPFEAISYQFNIAKERHRKDRMPPNKQLLKLCLH